MGVCGGDRKRLKWWEAVAMSAVLVIICFLYTISVSEMLKYIKAEIIKNGSSQRSERKLSESRAADFR